MEVSEGFLYTLYAFGALGAVYVLIFVLKFFYFFGRLFYIYWIPLSAQHERQKFQRYGKWAIVTGCTDGIGKEYALQLAAAKMNVVLLSRTQEKLDRLAQEIESAYKVETRSIAVDFSALPQIYEKIQEGITGLDIGVLINNVAMDYRYPMRFDEASEEEIMRVLNCNTVSLVKLTRMVLPGMLSKQRGLIVNVASTGALSPLPYIAMYTATKTFMDFLTQSLSMEYADLGIDVQVVLPGLLATKLSGLKDKPSLLVKDPAEYVTEALKSAGRSRRCHGCVIHEIQGVFFRFVIPLLPFCLKRRMLKKEMFQIRERKLALLEKQNEPLNSQAAIEHSELLAAN